MAKPILYWTIKRRNRWNPEFEPFGVTSEGARGRINGRFVDDYASHCNKRDVSGKFDTLEAAQAKCAKLAIIRKEYAAKIEPLERKAQDLRREERQAHNKELATND